MLEFALWLQVALWLAVTAVFCRSRQASVFHPAFFYLIFHGLVFVARPVLVAGFHFWSAFEYMQFTPTDDAQVLALAVSSVALLLFVGVSCYSGQLPHSSSVVVPLTGRPGERTALWLTWLLLGPFALYSAVFGIGGYSLEGTGNVQMERVGGIAVFTNTTGYVVDANQMLLPLVVLTLLVSRSKALGWSLASCYVAYRSVIGWGRWTIVVLVICIALVRLWRHGRRWPGVATTLKAAGFVPVLYLGFTALGDNRDVVRRTILAQQVDHELFDSRPFAEKLDNLDFANFDYLTYVVSVVPDKTRTYTYGTQYLQLLTEPVPRILWAGKPYGPPITTFDLNDYGNFLGLTVSLAGDGWISGGWLGLLLTVGMVALLLGRLHRKFWLHRESKARSIAYLILLAVSIQLFRDGGISIFKFLFFTVAPVALWGYLTRVIERHALPQRMPASGMPQQC